MGERDRESGDSVYDLLYADHTRVGIYLSQFNDHGALTQLARSVQATDKKDFKGNVGFASMGGDSSQQTGLTKTFDPRWAQCLALMDELYSRDMINAEHDTANIGEFVLASGSLIVADTETVQRLYKNPAIRQLAAANAARAAAAGMGNAATDADFEALQEIPPQVQAHLQTSAGVVWSTLRPEGMITPPAEMSMKYGVSVDGRWSILGVKDANPTPPATVADDLKELQLRYADNPFHFHVFEMVTRLRTWLGRPLNCYGITPLVIFREITK
jgi:hypothetical protein